jgi:hypothetical protein
MRARVRSGARQSSRGAGWARGKGKIPRSTTQSARRELGLPWASAPTSTAIWRVSTKGRRASCQR